jgi:hypothetical protein
MPLATHSRIASKWVNCLPRCLSGEGVSRLGGRFGPSAARRRDASIELSPAVTEVISDLLAEGL